MKKKQMSITSGTLLLTATGLFAQALGFFYRVKLSQIIGAETLGLYHLILPVYSLLYAVTAIGLTSAASTLSARVWALGDRGGFWRVLQGCTNAFFLLILPIGTAVIVFSEFIATELLCDTRTRLGIILLVPCILLTGLEDIYKYCYYGIGRIGVPAASESFEQVIRTGAVLGLLALFLPVSQESTVGLIVAGMIFCEAFSVVFLRVASRSLLRRRESPSESSDISWTQIFRIAAPICASSAVTTLISAANYVLIPQKLIEGGMGLSASMTSFGVLCGMTIPMLMLPTGFVSALGLTVVPNLAQKSALGREQEICRQLSKALSSISVIIAPILALLIVTGSAVGQALFHNDQVGEYSLPLAAGTMFYCWQLILSGALNSLGQQRVAASHQLTCSGVQLAFTWFAVPRYGLLGYVAGFLCMQALNFFLDFTAMRRALHWRPKLLQSFAPTFLSALLMALIINFMFQFLIDARVSVTLSFVLCLCPACAAYLLTLRLQGVRMKTLFRQRGLG